MKILIVDDHEIIRKMLISMLETIEGVEGIEEAEDVAGGIQVLKEQTIDIVILDLNLGNGSGFDIIDYAQRDRLGAKFVICTGSRRKSDFEKAKAYNVQGYMTKYAPLEEILYGMGCVLKGRVFYSSSTNDSKQKRQEDKRLQYLTEREKEVFVGIGKGLSNQEIAEQLYISENTVKKHITSLMYKLQYKRRTEIALYATQIWRRKGEL